MVNPVRFGITANKTCFETVCIVYHLNTHSPTVISFKLQTLSFKPSSSLQDAYYQHMYYSLNNIVLDK